MAASGSLGNLSINVIAEIAELVSDMGKAQSSVNEFAKEAKESLDSVTEGFKSLLEIAGVGIGLEGLKEVAAQAIEAAEQLDHLSQSTGISVATLQTMQFAATLTGTSLDVASSAMEKLERSAVQANSGNVQMVEAFKAIGISATQLGDLIKHPDELIQQVTEHIAEFGNGAGKTTVAMALMGRGAAQNIPLINELGEGFAKLSDEAAEFGIRLTAADQSSLLEANESLDRLKASAIGLGNEFAVALSPAIQAIANDLVAMANSDEVKGFFSGLKTDITQLVIVGGQFTSWLAETGAELKTWSGGLLGQFQTVASGVGVTFHTVGGDIADFIAATMDEIDQIETSLKNMALYLDIAFAQAWADVQNGTNAALAGIKKGLQEAGEAIKAGLGQESYADAIANIQKLGSAYVPVVANVKQFTDQIAVNNQQLAGAKLANQIWALSVRDSASALGSQATNTDTASKALINYNANAEASQKLNEEIDKAWSDLQTTIDTLQGKVDPLAKAFADYTNSLIKVDQEGAKLIQLHQNIADVQAKVLVGAQAATAEYQRQAAVIAALNSIRLQEGNAVAQLFQKYQSEADALNQSDAVRERVKAELEAEKAVRDAVTASIKSSTDATGQEQAALAASLPTLIAQAKAYADNSVAAKANQEVMKQWQSIATQGFDAVGNSIAGFATGSIKNWHDFGQSLITDTEQFISAIIAEFLKLEVFNGIINQLFNSNLPVGLSSLAQIGTAGNAATAGTSAAGLNPTSFLSLGSNSNWLTSFLGGSGSTGYNMLGTAGGDIGDYATNGIPGATTGSYGIPAPGVAGSGYSLGEIASFAGALYSGFNEFKSAGGGVAGLAGGLTYGVGTLAIGTAISAGLSGGIAAGFAAIPVVGWVALGAMALNSLTGGGLFGTSAKAYGSEQNINVGQDGASLNQMVDLKGKKPLFGGTYWETQNVAVDPAQTAAINQFFKSLQDEATAAATSFGETTANIVTGSFHETFDTAGKMLTETSTVLGKQYTESVSDFQNRLLAETLLAQIPAASGAEQIAQQWRNAATDLLAGSEFLAQAELDITKGHALVQDETLAQLTTFVTGMEAQGETLIQTYARLSTETTTVQAIFDNLGVSTGLTGEALVKFDDDMVKAAGSLDNLTSEFQSYYSEYYSAAEQQANTQKQLQANLTSTFAAIGEDSTESMATFRQHMDAAINSGTLTGPQLQQWFAAAQALYLWTQAAQQQTSATDAATTAQQQAQAVADSFQLTLSQLGITTGLTGQAFVDFTSDMVKTAGSLSAAQSAWNTYFKEYYSASEQAKASMDSLRDNSESQLSAIGEDPTESMAKFREDFSKGIADGTIKGDQIAAWLAAGDALAQFTTYMQQSDAATVQAGQDLLASQTKYQDFIAGFDAIINPIDAFQQSMSDLGTTLQKNIDQANQLAIAAGMSGASAADLGKILEASAIQGAQALQKEFADAQSLVQSIWGTSLDSLNSDLTAEKAKLAGVDPDMLGAYQLQAYYQKQIDDTQKQIDAANAAAAQAQKVAQENSLLKDMGDIGSVTGQSFENLANQLGIPLDQLEKDLGLSKDQLEKQFSVYEQQALAAMGILNNTGTTNELLQDIVDYYDGKPFSFTSTIADPTTDTRDAPGTGRHIGPIGTPGPATQYIAVLTSTPSVGGANGQPITVRLHPEDRELLTRIDAKLGGMKGDTGRLVTAGERVAISNDTIVRQTKQAQPYSRNTAGRSVTS